MITINLKRCKKQLNILNWAFEAMEGLPEDDQKELWGRTIETPFIVDNGIVSLEVDVLDDLKYRLEDQYLQMAEAEVWDEVNDRPFNYANEERAVYEILNKIMK